MAPGWESTSDAQDAVEVTASTTDAAELPAAEKGQAKAHGWDAPTPLNYEALGARREDQEALEEAGTLHTWAHNAVKYEWNDEYGDIGPVIPELERQLFTKEHTPSAGDSLRVLSEFTVTQEGPTHIKHIRKFEDAGLHPILLKNVELAGYKVPTPVQAYCLPGVLTGNDVIAVAQTGSGKTAAYLIPVLSRLMGKVKKLAAARPNPIRYNAETDAVRAEPLVLIICPTRELATQIFDEARRLCYRSMLRPCVAYGGGPKREQLADLQRGCDILIGTPGRLKDFITRDSRWITLNRLKYTILDEADEMLNPDWEDDLKEMLGGGASQDDGDHQFMMFSATFPKEARQLARKYLADDHVRVRVGRAGSAHSNIQQTIVWVEDEMKQKALNDLLLDLPPCRTLVFVNTSNRADLVDDFLYNLDFPVTSIHSGRTQREREDAIRAFRTGKCPIMVATAVSARGLDIKNVMHIINYDLPSTEHGGIDEYVHRIGRTARIGNKGQATSFYSDRNSDLAGSLVKLLLECKQNVPDFLQEHAPKDGIVTWDDDTDDEGEDSAKKDKLGGGWGTAGTVVSNDDAAGVNGDGAGSCGAKSASDTASALDNVISKMKFAAKAKTADEGWGVQAAAEPKAATADDWGSGSGSGW